MEVAGLALPVVAALIFVWRAAPRHERAMMAVPAAALATGMASVVAFALLAVVRSRAVFIGLDVAAWLALAAAAWRTRGPVESPPAPAAGERRSITAATFVLWLVIAAVAIVSFAAATSVFPHGEWDAWAQWNLRARFFFRGFADGTWRSAFAPVLAWSHPDYPLLIPLSVMRLWLYGGADSVAAPIVFGGLTAAAAVAIAGLAVTRARGAARGFLTAATILACPSFVRYSAAQCADVALALYVLSTFVLWTQATAAPRARTWWVLAGMSAALAAWTKNEGLAFLGIFFAALIVERLRAGGPGGLRDLVSVLAGAVPVLAAVVVFKLWLAPPSYFTAEQSLGGAAAGLLDPARLRVVLAALTREVWLTGALTVGVLPFLAAFVAVRGFDAHAPAPARGAPVLMVLLLAAYAAAYLMTPKDLGWQLRTSIDRVVLHVVPTLAWSAMTLSR